MPSASWRIIPPSTSVEGNAPKRLRHFIQEPHCKFGGFGTRPSVTASSKVPSKLVTSRVVVRGSARVRPEAAAFAAGGRAASPSATGTGGPPTPAANDGGGANAVLCASLAAADAAPVASIFAIVGKVFPERPPTARAHSLEQSADARSAGGGMSGSVKE